MHSPLTEHHRTGGDSDLTHVSVLLDRSGSMSRIAGATIEAFNMFLFDQQRRPGRCWFTLVQFDTEDDHHVHADALPIREVLPLDASSFVPRGGTPLWDAADLLIERLDGYAHANPDHAQLVLVITDGQENASRMVTEDEVRDTMGDRILDGWDIVFLGANQDSYGTGDTIGAAEGNISNFTADERGIRTAFESVNRATHQWRDADHDQRGLQQGDFFGGVKEAEN